MKQTYKKSKLTKLTAGLLILAMAFVTGCGESESGTDSKQSVTTRGASGSALRGDTNYQQTGTYVQNNSYQYRVIPNNVYDPSNKLYSNFNEFIKSLILPEALSFNLNGAGLYFNHGPQGFNFVIRDDNVISGAAPEWNINLNFAQLWTGNIDSYGYLYDTYSDGFGRLHVIYDNNVPKYLVYQHNDVISLLIGEIVRLY